MASNKEMEETTVSEKEESVKSKVRVANGTWLHHYENTVSTRVFQSIQARVNTIDFNRAEQFQVLRYRPGGHYAPHLDYLEHTSQVLATGNRIATFLVIMKTAEEGGGTVFPQMGVTVQPNPGDAMFWFNMNQMA